MIVVRLLTLALLGGAGLPGCTAEGPATPVAASAPSAPRSGSVGDDATAAQKPLAGTAWRLVEFQSMDDAVGAIRPEDPAEYTMHLRRDGTVAMQLACNRATGTWSVEPSRDPSNGRFRFGPLAVTSALCPPPRLDERIAADARWVRGYLLREGRLHLSLMADGGIYSFEPLD